MAWGLLLENEMERFEIRQFEDKLKWDKAVAAMPAIEMPVGVKVKVIPPFGGAMARFWLMSCEGERIVSVFADFTDMLGSMGQPYWEMYAGDDIERFLLDEVTELEQALQYAVTRHFNKISSTAP